jgi:nucleoid DNA-binding protein
MNSQHIRDRMVEVLGCAYVDAEAVQDVIAAIIRTRLKGDGYVKIPLLGEFRIVHEASRSGLRPRQNPEGKFVERGYTGYVITGRNSIGWVENAQPVVIRKPTRKRIRFRPVKSMLEALSRGEVDDRAQLLELIEE